MYTYFATITFLFGCIIGSFLNVCIYRIPQHESIVVGSSHCPKCLTPIRPYDLIPIFSFVMLRGKCRTCKAKISFRYPAIELLTGCLFLGAFLRYSYSWNTLIGFVFSAVLVVIAMIDFDTMDIYNEFQFIIIGLAIFSIIVLKGNLIDHLIGSVMISAPFFLIAYFTQGLGGGDIKLMAAGGLLLGVQSIAVASMIGIISGGIIAAFLLIFKKKGMKSMIPFGPFLCIGLYVAYLFGTTIFQWYFSLFMYHI
jgi:leader peptidase (prepilin peptidase) / N-methyltransferase